MKPDPSDEEERRAASLWYDRFEQKRQASSPPPGRLRMIRYLLLGSAAALVILGLGLRSDRLRLVMGTDHGRVDWPALLSRELALDERAGATFFPLWETWRRGEEEEARRRDADLATLAALSAQQSDLNQEQDRLLARLEETRDRRAASRRELVATVRDRLGLWRAARLQVLLETKWPAEPGRP
ncbi:MAG: hypothetical protein Q8O14_10315 [bacterium]|nr:hypothetical protein [bacterium]